MVWKKAKVRYEGEVERFRLLQLKLDTVSFSRSKGLTTMRQFGNIS